MPWFSRTQKTPTPQAPPVWAPATELDHKWGKFCDAPEKEYEDAERFCAVYPLEQPKLLPSNVIDNIRKNRAEVWTLVVPYPSRFMGRVSVGDGSSKGGFPGITTITTEVNCGDTCLLSNIPIIGGLYNVPSHLKGVYYEIKVRRMDGVIALGTACRPYPTWRLPGWNRMSAALHLDDMRKFFENPNGGQDYSPHLNAVQPEDVVGCGYEFKTGELFFTYNGARFPPAFTGIYFPRTTQDVYAAIGMDGSNDFEVNFGADIFIWKPANTEEWKVTSHIGNLDTSVVEGDALPSYADSGTSAKPRFGV